MNAASCVLAAVLAASALSTQAAPATPFRLTDTAGVVHTQASHRGQWILVNVWASWCAPCFAELPELQALAQAHPEVVVLGLAVDSTPAQIQRFVERLHITYPIVVADDGAVRQFPVRGFPTTILIGPDGEQVAVKEGGTTRRAIEAAIAAHSR